MNTLILVDIQNDLMPGGALAKPDGHDIVSVDNGHRRATGLTDCPREPSVTGACAYSVATNFCVKCTCLDARSEGGESSIIADACVIAGREVTAFVETRGAIDKIIFCCFSADIRTAYEQVIKA